MLHKEDVISINRKFLDKSSSLCGTL